ncbi:Nn.00g065070.m01.CDS01 [Neocucurbitaria sp. VM-36]
MSVTPLTRDQIEQAVYMDEPQSKKRKLDLVKCDRCRDDKQKCLPVNRIYPIKCDRCIEKGLSCSEGKRATRRSKQEPTIKPLPSSTIPVLNADEEILFDQWLFLLNYHSNLTMAVERLRNLEREIFKPFLDPVPKVMLRVYASIDMESLEGFTNELGAILTRVGSTLRKAALRTSEHLPASMLSSLIGSTLPVVSPTATCLLCIDFSAVSMLGCPTSRKFLDTQTQLSGHSEANHFHQGPVNRTLLKDTVSRYVKMSKKVQWDAHETFLRIGMVEMSHMSHQIGWYHPQGVGYQLFLERAEVVDCLGRSPLHFWLDDISRDLQGEELEILKEPGYISILNKPDILGRTPLHITCQYGWEAATQVLLELGADPGLRTCFLSLPLHYAAARGSAAICSMLLAHMDNSDIHDMDCEDQTALTYADDNRYAEVAMLIDRYDKNQEEPSGSSSPHEEVPIANEGNSGSSEIRITAPSANVPGGIDTFVTVAQWESLSALQENNQLRKPLDASNLDSQHYATSFSLDKIFTGDRSIQT